MTEEFLPLDTQAIQALARILKETDLSEIEYESHERRIRVVRQLSVVAPLVSASAPAVAPAAPSHPAAPAASAYKCTVTSPMVGTAYLAPSPGSAPFVRLGDMVSEGQTVMIVEAMKVMNPIKAPQAGRIAHIFVQDGTPVEFGETLLGIE